MRKFEMKRITFLHIMAVVFLLGAFVSPVIYSGIKSWLTRSQYTDASPLSESEQRAAVELQNSYMNIYQKASRSVVYIRTNILVRSGGFWFDFYRERQQAGSGFIIDSKGHIVTNNHVVAGARKINVIFHDNTKRLATLVGRDEASDVALIKVDTSKGLQPAVLGDSDKVQVGQLAFALGAPFGFDRTFTVGIISAKHRRIDQSRYSRIQTDASINPGNSGGPLLNVYGEVVGINQSILAGRGGGNVGIGFAIPVNEAKTVISQLRKERRVIGKPAIGVHIALPSEVLRRELKLGKKEGVIVVEVLPDSSADKAGLKEYDFIYKVNRKQVNSSKDLIGEVQKVGVGGRLLLHLIREGKEKTLSLVVGENQAGK